MNHRPRWGLVALQLSVLAALFGCAEQQPPVNRVEAYALPKTLFTGEWYYQQTVVEVPGTRTVTFEGETAFMGTHRVRWDIQENYLYARMAYEKVKGGKVGSNQDTGEYLGEIAGAWRIAGHFDIKRGYNPTTGEENNVLEENGADCKWYACKYMRVDWSKNLAIDFMFLDYDEDIKKEGIPFYQQDNDPKFKPIFDDVAGYIDITTAMAVAPGSIYFPWWNIRVPYCWLYDADQSCNTEIVKVRNSFWKRDPNRDYEPRVNKGKKDSWFGYFNTEKWVWEPERGLINPAKDQFLQRHNLWAANHYADKACKSDKECTEAGSRCDTNIEFHKNDVATDSDFDGLPDAFEAFMDDKDGVKLSSSSADSDGDGLPDGQDDADGNGKRDFEDFWAWARTGLEYRCTIPMAKRDPKPVVYFNTGYFPWSLVCDEHGADPAKDAVKPCKKWEWTADPAVQETKWTPLHHAHESYTKTFWRIYLRGAFGWELKDYEAWISTRDPSKVGGKKADLDKFGDSTLGYYSFALCANNPVEKDDPWPCRFPRHSFKQAKELIDKGLTYNHMSYEQAKKLLEAGKDVDQSAPFIRPGDIRYSNVHWAKDYSAVSPLGYGPSAFDPRTGEILSGFANMYAYVDFYATYMQEIVDLLNGKIKPTEYINGLDLNPWLEAHKFGPIGGSKGEGGEDLTSPKNARVVSPADLQAMYQATEQEWMKKIPKVGDSKAFEMMRSPDGKQMNNRQIKQKLLGTLAQSGVFDPSKAPVDLSAIKGTALERRLIDNEILMASGFMPTGPFSSAPKTLTDDVLDRASVARGGFVEMLDAREQWRMDVANRKSILFADMVDEGAASLAYRLAKEQPDKVWNIARKLITRPVLEHEMGHTVGLMHNFGGSDDALNFHPEYWRVRTNDYSQTNVCNHKAPGSGDLCPFFIKPKTNYQLGKDQKNLAQNVRGMEEYAYASIMDYDRWPTLMSNGLGRYDDAAMMYGYADKVEVFKSKGNVPDGTGGGPNVFEEWWDSDGSVLMLYSNRAQAFHYTNWYTQMKDPSGDPKKHLALVEDNRQLVDYRDIKEEMNQYGRSDGWYYKNGNTKMVRVPYIYCSHNAVNISESCMTWDWGADQFERMDMHINDWDTWYVLNAFTRYRYKSPFFADNEYINRRYGRFYKRMKNFNNLYALYQGLFHQWYNQQQIQDFFTDPVNGWGAYTVSMHDAFNVLMRTIAMPDVKGFKDKAPEADGQVIYSESVWSNEELFETDITTGRFFTTSWNDTNYNRECGYEWWECLHHFGFYLDKVIALLVLSDPQTYFVARDTAEDIRQWRISFFDNYTDQIIDYFGAMLSEDYDKVAPWFDPSKPRDKAVLVGGVEWRNGVAARNYAVPSLDPKKPAGGAAVESSTRFTLQLYGAVLGMFRFQNNFDNQYVERGRMWKKGKGTAWTVTPTDKIDGVTEYSDPFTGTTYVGVMFKDGRGIAQKMIAHANALKARTKYCSQVPGAPDECVAGSDQQRSEGALYEYRQLMDVMVQVSTMYDTFVGNWSKNPFDP